jgi:hypothetical protein
MPDASLPDEFSSLEKRCIGIDGERIFAYPFPHKPFIMNFHNLALLSINKAYTMFGKKCAKCFSVDVVPTSAKTLASLKVRISGGNLHWKGRRVFY